MWQAWVLCTLGQKLKLGISKSLSYVISSFFIRGIEKESKANIFYLQQKKPLIQSGYIS